MDRLCIATESILDSGNISADLVSNTVNVFTDDNSVYCKNGVFTYNIINYKGDLVATSKSNEVDYRYNAYGTKISEPTNVSNPIGYRNYYYDSETGLYYLKARYYDPATGQFTQEDTVQDDNLQYNLYGYCSGNPILYTDPSGHCYKTNSGKICHDNWTLYEIGNQEITDKGINFIKRCESFKEYKYKATSNEKYFTIGYGHYDVENKYKDYVKGSKKMTKKEATKLLKSDLAKFESTLNDFCKKNRVRLAKHQFDACIVDSFQRGQNIWYSPNSYSIVKFLLNTSDRCFFNKSFYKYNDVKNAFVSNNSWGGLKKRRIAEAKMFYNGKYIKNVYD